MCTKISLSQLFFVLLQPIPLKGGLTVPTASLSGKCYNCDSSSVRVIRIFDISVSGFKLQNRIAAFVVGLFYV